MTKATTKISKKFLYLIIFSYAIEGLVENTFATAWPSISSALHINISHIGIVISIYYICSSVSCILTSGIRKKLGTNYTSILSLAFYILAYIIMFFAKGVAPLMLGVVALGFGVGITEVNTDSYVIKAYDAKWDSFMHAFWGVGSFAAPLILGFSLYLTSSYHLSLVFVLIICLITVFVFIIYKRAWIGIKKKAQ